jgi:hypothetical protein
VGTPSHTDSVPPYLTDLLLGRSFAQVCCAKMSSSEFIIMRRFHPHIAKSNSLSGHFFPYGQRSPVSYREAVADSPTWRRRGGGRADRRLPPTLRRPPPSWRRSPPTAADLLGWRPPHMSGVDLRRTVAKCAEVHDAPKRRRI